MKQGTTPTLEFKLDIEISNVTEVIFTFTDELAYKGTSDDETTSYLLQKNYPDDATFEDDVFKLPLTQEETDLLTNTFYVEAQVICDKAVVKSDIKKINMPHTLWTTYVDDNESDGQSEVIHLSFSDNVIVEGGGSSNYNDLTNKPRINNIELVGNKTTSDLGLDITAGDGLKRVGNVVSADLDDNSILEFNNHKLSADTSGLQPTITGGNGIDVSSDTVSVDLVDSTNNPLSFYNGKLRLDMAAMARNSGFRMVLTDTNYANPLARKDYVDNLISTSLKRLVVEQLPQNPNTYTIYMVLRQAPTTNNIYDEYMYINNAWELIGTTEVDLSGYQEKLIVGNGIDITNDTISVKLTTYNNILNFVNGELWASGTAIANDPSFQATMPYDTTIRQALTTGNNSPLQPKLTAGTNITITDNVISASGGGNPITDTAKGSTISLTDSADSPLDAISIMGKSTQNGTPTIDNPIPIVDITQEEVEITNGTDTQSATLTKTLRGIPVSSGGNYTDNNNQQWICDTIERYKDGSGKYIQRVASFTFDGTEDWQETSGAEQRTRLLLDILSPIILPADTSQNNNQALFSCLPLGTSGSTYNRDDVFTIATYQNHGRLFLSPTINGIGMTVSQWTDYLINENQKLIGVLATPIETPLTSEELAELELSTYYPITNISSNADVVVEYVCDTKNYIDKKIGELS